MKKTMCNKEHVSTENKRKKKKGKKEIEADYIQHCIPLSSRIVMVTRALRKVEIEHLISNACYVFIKEILGFPTLYLSTFCLQNPHTP